MPYRAIEQSIRLLRRYTPVTECGCWLWLGALDQNGYGRIGWMTPTGYRSLVASRASWHVHFGFLPDQNVDVCHKCDTPSCINPDHLFIGTRKENQQDMVRKGRCRAGMQNSIKTHCTNGHEFTIENTVYVSDGRHRQCRECRRKRSRDWQRANRAKCPLSARENAPPP